MGGDAFCFKVCDPAGPRAAELCQHIFDRIGCAYNAPNNAQNGTFVACLGDNQDPPGVYTSDGQGEFNILVKSFLVLKMDSLLPFSRDVHPAAGVAGCDHDYSVHPSRAGILELHYLRFR